MRRRVMVQSEQEGVRVRLAAKRKAGRQDQAKGGGGGVEKGTSHQAVRRRGTGRERMVQACHVLR